MIKTIKDFTDVELKALAYDQIALIEQCQNNLKNINAEFEIRAKTKNEENKTDVSGSAKGATKNTK